MKTKIYFCIAIFLIILSFSVSCSGDFKKITVISPNGGEKLYTDARYSISWDIANIEKIDIYYSIDNADKWHKIASNIDTKIGAFGWKVPLNSGVRIKIKISDSYDSSFFDISDDFILISAK